jgi:hypothetical protein
MIQLFYSHSDGNHPHEKQHSGPHNQQNLQTIQFSHFGIRFGNIRDEVQIRKPCDKLMWLVFINPETNLRADLSF